MRRGTLELALLGLGATLLLGGAPVFAQERIALVIGNADYPASLGRLENTHGDAERIATALEAVGFDVDLRYDADEAGMETAVDSFLARLEANPGAIAFFYYSGHGVSATIRGERANLLVPAKESFEAFSQLPTRSLRLDVLVDALETTGAQAAFVVSDACRNELALAGDRGLDKGFSAISSRPGMLIAYATAEGATAPDDGVFAAALAEQIVRSGQDASVAFLRAMQMVSVQRSGGAMPFFTPGYIPADLCFADCAAGGVPVAEALPLSVSVATDQGATGESSAAGASPEVILERMAAAREGARAYVGLPRTAMVVARADLFDQPGGAMVGRLEVGSVVTVVEQSRDLAWVLIESRDGEGYVRAETVRPR